MAHHSISVTVNGSTEYLTVPSQMTLLQMLREELALTGAKNGCEAGECGACTVLVDGEPVNSCMMLAVEADGREVVTVEGLAHQETFRVSESPKGLSALQEAFVEHNAVQCGFCTPGMLISAHALLERNPDPSEEEIREALVRQSVPLHGLRAHSASCANSRCANSRCTDVCGREGGVSDD